MMNRIDVVAKWIGLTVLLLVAADSASASLFSRKVLENEGRATSSSGVQLIQQENQVIVDNGFLRVIFSVPEGMILGINYGGIDNLLNGVQDTDNRGCWFSGSTSPENYPFFLRIAGSRYFDANWNEPGQGPKTGRIHGETYNVTIQNEDQVELSFRYTYDNKGSGFPLNVDKRFVVLRNVSGFYTYAIYERLQGWSDLNLDQTRVVFKLNEDKFVYMALSDERQRIMPTARDRETGKPLAYPEAVLLTNPSNQDLQGEVDDKYQYSAADKDIWVHGWISFNPGVGFWLITPSHEYEIGGPMKQDLTSHVGPVTLGMFMSNHYAGRDMQAQFRNGEPWKKVFGPVFVYLNSVEKNPLTLWDDARRQMLEEVHKWPYAFPASPDFPPSNQRGLVFGQLRVNDRYMQGVDKAASNAFVGLAAPGEAGSWQVESKGYQFWVQASDDGYFSIKNVRPGTYNLYAWVPGYLGDYIYAQRITVTPGQDIKLGVLTFHPPRHGPTLWEIGVPDRTASEFFVPDPNPTLTNGLYNRFTDQKFRQYGLWERYGEIYPDEDLTFTADLSVHQTDWFFAHVTRKTADGSYQATTWKIAFSLKNIRVNDIYKLRIALASATNAEIQVRVNDPNGRQHFTTGLIGRDNAIARHGIHGIYWLFEIDVPGNKLVEGDNALFLAQTRTQGPFNGVMYDYIRFEGPPE